MRLSAGTYTLTHPLVLSNPVTITADPGATLLFAQDPNDAPWTAAIKIHAGNTTLDGFAVRFAGPVRWNWSVNYGPAVIGTTDNLDPNQGGLKVNLAFTHLDLQGPPASGTTTWENAPNLIRLISADSGRIEQNTLMGGMIQFLRGPWSIVGNTDLGTPAGTYNDGVFCARHLRSGPPRQHDHPRGQRRQDLAVPGADQLGLQRHDRRQHGHRRRPAR